MIVPSPALANGGLPPGVHVSPGSPSQHQYVIPVNAARSETGGGGGGHGSGSGQPLFGNGIKPGSGSSSGGGSGPGAQARAHAAKPGSKGLHAPSYALASSSGKPLGSGSSGSDGGSGWVPLVAGGAAVLLLGCGGGFALRRRMVRT